MRTKSLIGIGIGGFAAWWLINKASAAIPAPRPLPLQGLGNVGFLAEYASADTMNAWARGLYGYTPDLGKFKLKKAFRGVAAPLKKLVKKGVAPVAKVLRRDLKQVKRDVTGFAKLPGRVVKRDFKHVTGQMRAVFGRDPLTGKLWQKKASASQDVGPSGAVETVYQDENGNTISKEQYHALMREDAGASADSGVVARPWHETSPSGDDMLTRGQDGDLISADPRADSEWNQPAEPAWAEPMPEESRDIVGDAMLQAAAQESPVDGAIFDNGVWWFQESDGTWAWLDERTGNWVMEEPTGAYDGDAYGMNGLGASYGSIRDQFESSAKKIAGNITPSGAIYKYVKHKKPELYKDYRKTVKVATPYAMIVGGAVLSIVSFGALSPAGVAMMASGAVALGSQIHTDYQAHETKKELRGIEAEAQYAEIQAAKEAKQVEDARLASAGESANRSETTLPIFDADWWMGDTSSDNSLTVGEMI